MAVAGIHGHGAVGEGGVQRMLGGKHRRVPSVFAPPLREQPALRLAGGKGAHAPHAVGLAFAQEVLGQGARVQRAVEGVHVGVVQARTYERVAVIHHARGRRAEGIDVGGVHHGKNASVAHAHGGGLCVRRRGKGNARQRWQHAIAGAVRPRACLHAREHVAAHDDEVCLVGGGGTCFR